MRTFLEGVKERRVTTTVAPVVCGDMKPMDQDDGDFEVGPASRLNLRHRRKGPANLNPNPKLSAEVRAKYMEPIVPWQMWALPLQEYDGIMYGLVSRADMEAYAATFEVGCRMLWYTSQAGLLKLLAPPSASDPIYRASSNMVRPELRAKPREAKIKPLTALVDRALLRQHYAELAQQYLAGPPRTSKPSAQGA